MEVSGAYFGTSAVLLFYPVAMIYDFGDFELDLGRAELRKAGDIIAVEPQVFALIAFLVEHRERLVSRDEIFEKVWDGRVVSDSALASRIKSARKALGDDGKAQRFIKTVHGKGLRFVADVRLRREPIVESDTRPTSADPEAGGAAAASRPSIAVLPFNPIGDTGAWASIAEGLPHELIADLARLRWLFVVARASSFRLRGDEVDPREAGRLLGVRYCLSGSVEIVGTRMFVTTELVDARGGDVIWAERYEGSIDDVHSMRERIRASILTQLEIQIPMHEASGARLAVTDNLDAWSAYHLGLQHLYRFNSRDNALAAELFRKAVADDSTFARAHAGLSFVHFQTAFLRQTDDITGEIERARQYAQRGVDLDPLDPFVNFTMGRTYWLEGDLDRAMSWLNRSTSLSPNYAQGHYARGWTEAMAGIPGDAREHIDLAMNLSPLDPLYYAMLSARGFTHLALDDAAEAVKWTERGARSPGAHPLIAMVAAATQAVAGNTAEALRWAEDVRRRNPLLTREDFFRSFPMREGEMRKQLSAALESIGFAGTAMPKP